MSVSPFDNSAAGYDAEFTHTPIGKLQRRRVYKYLLPLLNKNSDVLEINCGTGHDAISLAPAVKSFLATDVSDEMIKVCLQKKETHALSNLTFKKQDIRTISAGLNSHYDILLSNFGGLNCLSGEDLENFAVAAAKLLKPGGKLALVIMGADCWLENLWFRLRKDKRLNRRKTKGGVTALVNGISFQTYYYSPAEITRLLEKNFTPVLLKPVGIFIPPSYINPFFAKRKWLLALLSLMENIFGGLRSLAQYSDHYILVMEKRNT